MRIKQKVWHYFGRKLIHVHFLFYLVLVSIAHAVTLHDLDHVLNKAKNLDDFLSRPELIQEYYEKSAEYYSKGKRGRFSREVYDALLGDLAHSKEKIPELKERLWGKANGERFTILAENDRPLENHWEPAEEKILSTLTVKAARLSVVEAMGIIQRKLDAKVKNGKDSAPPSQTEFESAVAHAVGTYLHKRFKDLGEDIPKKIQLLDDLRQKKFNLPDFPATPVITEQIKKLLPTRGQVEKEFSSGAGKDQATISWGFEPVRPFHGIFRGIELEECVGGKCVKALQINRWGLPAIQGNQLFYVEKDGKFRGYVHEIPITHPKQDGKVYGSIDILAYDFTKRVKLKGVDAKPSSPDDPTLFDAWYREAMKRKPKEWSGLAMSDGYTVNNANTRDSGLFSAYYTLSSNAGVACEFSITDGKMEKALYHQAKEISNKEGRYQLSYAEDKGVFECSFEAWRNRHIHRLADPELNTHPEHVYQELKKEADQPRCSPSIRLCPSARKPQDSPS